MRSAFLAVAIVATLGLSTTACGVSKPLGVCSEIADIPAEDLRAIEGAATRFVRVLTAAEAGDPWSMMTSRGRRTVSELDRPEIIREAPGGYWDLRVNRTFLVKNGGRPGQRVRVSCAGGGQIYFTDIPGRQAFVAVSAQADAHSFDFAIWLRPSAKGWQVEAYSRYPTLVGGQGFEGVWARAKRARAAGQPTAEWVLYSLANVLSEPTRFSRRGDLREFEADRDRGEGPFALSGPYPKSLDLAGERYSITNAAVYGAKDEGVRLTITLAPGVWKDETDARERGRRFLEAFRAAHPDWTQGADSLRVRIVPPGDGPTVRMTYHKTKGYLPDPPAP